MWMLMLAIAKKNQSAMVMHFACNNSWVQSVITSSEKVFECKGYIWETLTRVPDELLAIIFTWLSTASFVSLNYIVNMICLSFAIHYHPIHKFLVQFLYIPMSILIQHTRDKLTVSEAVLEKGGTRICWLGYFILLFMYFAIHPIPI